jgi:hypothetical protein
MTPTIADAQSGDSRRRRRRPAMAQTRRSRDPEGRATRGITRAGAATCRRQGGADDPFAVVMALSHHSAAERSNANFHNNCRETGMNTMRQE